MTWQPVQCIFWIFLTLTISACVTPPQWWGFADRLQSEFPEGSDSALLAARLLEQGFKGERLPAITQGPARRKETQQFAQHVGGCPLIVSWESSDNRVRNLKVGHYCAGL